MSILSIDSDQLFDLREHCARLSRLIDDQEVFAQLFSNSGDLVTSDGEELSWMNTSEWLYIAASVEKIDVNTVYFDSSLMFCGTALEFEVARSKLLSELIASVAIFNFVWGSFETAVKLIEPPKVPKSIKSGTSSIVDNAIFFLKSEFEPSGRMPFYTDILADFREVLEKIPHYKGLSANLRLQPHIGISGVGLHVVRKIRNKFAHGAMAVPAPEDWSGFEPVDAKLIELSTRIVLLTCQMLLITYTKHQDFRLEYSFEPFSLLGEQSFHNLLRSVHIKHKENNLEQLELFENSH